MKIIKWILLIFVLLFCWIACTNEKTSQTEEYVIKVDSVQVAETVTHGSKIVVEFYGIIGPNGCSSFSRFITISQNKTHNITVIGKRNVGENLMCPENLPILNGMKLELVADSVGIYTVEIVNPGIHNLITKKVTVQ